MKGDEEIKTPIGDIQLFDNHFNDDASKRLLRDGLPVRGRSTLYSEDTRLVVGAIPMDFQQQ